MNTPTQDFSHFEFLPTLDHLKVSVSDDFDALVCAQNWLSRFSDAVKANDVTGVLATFHPKGWWRDVIALTWDIRAFHSSANIERFLNDRLVVTNFSVSSGVSTAFQENPYPDLVWIIAQFAFTTVAGSGTATAFLVPASTDEWQAFIFSTNLDSIKDLQEHTEPGMDPIPDAPTCEQAFEDQDPEVLIVGAGQSGLALAAQLKHVGVTSVMVEKNARIGDQWRNRYDSLRLFVWASHTPYLKFPDSFPISISAKKLADWYEFYARAMGLNYWTSTTVVRASRSGETGKWAVTVLKQDGTERTLHVDHLVFATGWIGDPKVPEIPGRGEFQGEVIHSADYRNTGNHAGKKVIVVGASTSAHDIAADFAYSDIDVTLIQRSQTFMITAKQFAKLFGPYNYKEGGPPTELADHITLATPLMLYRPCGRRDMTAFIEEDADRRAKLAALGYRMHNGDCETGALWQIFTRGSGQYFDQGACDLIIEGKIKIKSGTQLERFTKDGLRFTDGSELQADLVVFATGWGDLRDPIKRVIGADLGQKLTKIWGLDDDGELSSIAKEVGIPGLWYLSGSLLYSRVYSKPLALQIKARQAGVYTGRYSGMPVN